MPRIISLAAALVLSTIVCRILEIPNAAYAATEADEIESSDADSSNEEESSEEEEESTPDIELPEPLLSDINGDEIVDIIAFGDSITRGVGDFIGPNEEVEEAPTPTGEAGYPLRTELYLGVNVSNLGDPGERLSTDGLYRFAATIPSRKADFVVISGGTNDAWSMIQQSEYFRSLQTMINIAKASGSVPVLATIPPTCCNGYGLNPFINQYNPAIHSLAAINEVPLADVRKGYDNECEDSDCKLLNRPEGIHPNILGYDIAGEIVTATFLNIDIFASDGALQMEQALGLIEGSIVTVPDEVTEDGSTENSE